eukprot:gene7664-1370_t
MNLVLAAAGGESVGLHALRASRVLDDPYNAVSNSPPALDTDYTHLQRTRAEWQAVFSALADSTSWRDSPLVTKSELNRLCTLYDVGSIPMHFDDLQMQSDLEQAFEFKVKMEGANHSCDKPTNPVSQGPRFLSMTRCTYTILQRLHDELRHIEAVVDGTDTTTSWDRVETLLDNISVLGLDSWDAQLYQKGIAWRDLNKKDCDFVVQEANRHLENFAAAMASDPVNPENIPVELDAALTELKFERLDPEFGGPLVTICPRFWAWFRAMNMEVAQARSKVDRGEKPAFEDLQRLVDGVLGPNLLYPADFFGRFGSLPIVSEAQDLIRAGKVDHWIDLLQSMVDALQPSFGDYPDSVRMRHMTSKELWNWKHELKDALSCGYLAAVIELMSVLPPSLKVNLLSPVVDTCVRLSRRLMPGSLSGSFGQVIWVQTVPNPCAPNPCPQLTLDAREVRPEWTQGHSDILRWVLQEPGADPNCTMSVAPFHTPLMVSISHNFLSCASTLVKAGTSAIDQLMDIVHDIPRATCFVLFDIKAFQLFRDADQPNQAPLRISYLYATEVPPMQDSDEPSLSLPSLDLGNPRASVTVGAGGAGPMPLVHHNDMGPSTIVTPLGTTYTTGTFELDHLLARDVSRVPISDDQIGSIWTCLEVPGEGYVLKDAFLRYVRSMDCMGVDSCVKDIEHSLRTKYNTLGKDRLGYDEFAVLMLQ